MNFGRIWTVGRRRFPMSDEGFLALGGPSMTNWWLSIGWMGGDLMTLHLPAFLFQS